MRMLDVRGRDGFAIPLTIFVLTIITLMLSATFVRVQVDRRVAESSGDMVDALTVATNGLYRFMDAWSDSTRRPADGHTDTLYGVPPGGNAVVVAHQVRTPPDTLELQLFILQSTGYLIKPPLGSEPQAERTVAQFANWQTGYLETLAGYTSINGFDESGGMTPFGALDGNDQCTAAALPGLYTPAGGTDYTPGDVPPTGPLQAGDSLTLALATKIGWATILGGGFDPDYTTLTNLNSWSSYLLTGDQTLVTNGSGLLVVTGDLHAPIFIWNGVVLVGGEFDPNGIVQVNGAIVSGLNEAVGIDVPRGRAGGAFFNVKYHSCNVRDAMASLTGFMPVEKAWVDNWATY